MMEMLPECLREVKRDEKHLLFIDAREVEHTGRRKFREKDISKIVDTYRSRSQEPGYSHIAKREEIVANAFELSVQRYVRRPHAQAKQPEVPLAETMRQIEVVEDRLAKIQGEIRNRLRSLPTWLKTASSSPDA